MSEPTTIAISALRSMFDKVQPSHVIIFHPSDEETVRKAARGHYVSLKRSVFVPPGRVYSVDRKTLSDLEREIETPPDRSSGAHTAT